MAGMEWVVLMAGFAAAAALVFVLARLGSAGRGQARMAETTEKMLAAQTELSGRLSQMAESGAVAQAQLSERLQAQERSLSKTLDERLADLTRRIGANLQQNTEKTAENLSEVKQRLAVIDAAQKNITELSGQMVGLQDILSNKQARGAFGEVQLEDLVRSILPPSAYEFQVTLGNKRRVDCLLKFPNPTGAIAVDAKFPLESYRALIDAGDDQARTRARRAFAADVRKHVGDIADRYIIQGETAEHALMFLPSEAVFAELHTNFQDVVEKSHRARVGIVSPTTMMATLTTMRAILKDAHMREQAGVIQQEVGKMMVDVGRLDDRVAKLQSHFNQAAEDIHQIRTSTGKITRSGERIEEMELDENDGAELPPASAEIRLLEPGRS
jgi:DNA recombination protein RmuC